MKILPATLIFCAGMLLHFHLVAQNTNTYLNNYVQPAPNAAALGKYADYPVGFYTGTPEISIPVYSLKDGTITLPISLNYHASGTRVSENASWVGLGWALNAGGIITRTVRGAPDEGTRKAYSSATGPRGYYANFGLSTMPLLPYPSEDQNTYNAFSQYFIPAVCEGAIDTEPDLYTFNFNGNTGKFVFDENRHARLLTDDNIVIEVSFAGGAFTSWKITTPDGIQYYFGENNYHEVTYPYSSKNGSDLDGAAPSSWYLTRMINPNTKDTATFSYAKEGYSYRDLGPETTLYGTSGGNNDITQSCNLSNIGVPDIITTGIYGLRLTAITTKNYQVKFIAKNQRQDLLQFINNPTNVTIGAPSDPGSPYANSLDSIKVFSRGTCLKQVFLAHSYFTSSTNTAASVLSFLSSSDYQVNGIPDVTDTKRLKLTSVTEFDGTGTIQNPSYVLTYNESIPLPRRLSYDQDHWGFSNNSIGNHNSFFTPNVTGLCTVPSSGGATRTPKWPDMSALILTGIKHPLGVSTTFQYEANNPNSTNQSATIVGGLRVVQIQATDNVTGKVEIRKISYPAGGILYRVPDQFYLVQLKNEYYHTGNSPISETGGYDGYSNNNPLIYNILRSAQSIVPLQDPQGNHISYSIVKETFGLNGEDGYRIHTYSVKLSDQSESSRIDLSHYTATGTIANITGTYGNGHFNDISPQSLVPYYSPYTPALLYPVAPQQVDIIRGNLVGESTWDALGNQVDSLLNVYSEAYHEDYLVRGFKAYRATNQIPNTSNYFNMDAMAYYKLHTGISHLLSSTKITYQNGQPVTEVSTHGYESSHHTLPTSDTTINSNGDVIIKKSYYSFDLTSLAGDVFHKMAARNLLLPVIARTWKNGRLIRETVTQFKDFAAYPSDTLINPVKIYAMESATSLTPAQAGESMAWDDQNNLVPNTYLKERANYNFDALTGKPLNEELTSGPNIAYQWGYNNTYPVARVLNAANSVGELASPSTGGAGFTLAKGSTQTISKTFTIVGGGSATVQTGFTGSPGTNPMVEIECTLSGPNGYNSSFQLCISAGTASCGPYLSNKTLTGLAAGQYTLSAYYYNAVNQNSDLSVTVSYPSQSVAASGTKEFFYEGFEDSTAPGVITGAGHTGNKFYNGASYAVNWAPASGRSYQISYWYRSGGAWKFSGLIVYSGSSYTLSQPSTDGYDDIRICPSDAQMTTYTYDPLVGLTSSTDAKGETTYYEYDSFQRLMNIRDKDGNIIKHMDYHYQGQ